MKAKDIMTRKVVTVNPDLSIEDLCNLLKEKDINGVPVVEPDGQLVGIVSQDDIIFRKSLGTAANRRPSDIRELFRRGFAPAEEEPAQRVEDIMTREVVSVQEDLPIREVSQLLWERRIHRVPVLQDGRVTGIISSLDICRVVSRRGGAPQ